MLLGSDLAAALGTSAGRATTTTIGAQQTPSLIADRTSPASARRRLLQPPSMARQRSPLFFAPNIFRPNECQHFHYDSVELGPVKVQLVAMDEEEAEEENEEESEKDNEEESEDEEEQENKRKKVNNCSNSGTAVRLTLSIESNAKIWNIVRTCAELVEFDRQLHRCVFDRRHSRLEELDLKNSRQKEIICGYVQRLCLLTGSLMRCYPVLTFFELDNRGNHFLPVERSLPNIPAVACAVAICPFNAPQSDQLRLCVGDIVSVVEIETKCDGKWMRGKLTVPSNDNEEIASDQRRFGTFPARCVRLFSDRLSLGEQLWMASNANSGTSTTAHSLARRSLPSSFSARQRRNGGRSPAVFSYALIRSFIVRLSKSAVASSHPMPFRAPSSSLSSSVFGVDLVELVAKNHQAQTQVADVVEQCLRVVESRGMEAGIYRQCGVQSNVRRLRRMFSSGNLPEWECPSVSELLNSDIHSVGSLLKHFFRQLPNPLIPFQWHAKVIDAFGTNEGSLMEVNGPELVDRVAQIVKEFPSAHYHNAKRLFLHLQRVALHSRTQTNARNLAIIWTPNLIRPCAHHQLASLNLHTDICTFLIAFADQIFADSSNDGSIGIAVSQSSSMDSIVVESWRLNQLESAKCNGKASAAEQSGNTQQNIGGVGAVHSIIDKPKSNKSLDQCTQSPPLGQRLLSPLGKSLDEMGHSMFRRVRSMRHSVRRKLFKETPKLSKSCQALALSPNVFISADKGMALTPGPKYGAAGNNTMNSSPSSLLTIPFADDIAYSSSRVSSSTSPAALRPLYNNNSSVDLLNGTTTRKWEERKAQKEMMAKTAEKRVNFEEEGKDDHDGEQQQRQQYGKKTEQCEDNRRDSVDSIPLDISRYDNVHSIVTNAVHR